MFNFSIVDFNNNSKVFLTFHLEVIFSCLKKDPIIALLCLNYILILITQNCAKIKKQFIKDLPSNNVLFEEKYFSLCGITIYYDLSLDCILDLVSMLNLKNIPNQALFLGLRNNSCQLSSIIFLPS